MSIQQEKIAQSIGILNELQLDCWLTFVRETDEQPDPALKLIVNHDLTWHSCFLLTRQGERIAIVARYDDDLVKQSELYTTVLRYTEDVGPLLRDTLTRLNPASIALNYSTSDVAADGLTHGMYLQLVEALKDTPFVERFVSSAPLVSRLRSRKTPSELALMSRAIRETDEVFSIVTGCLRPGMTECETSELIHAEMERRHLGAA